MTDSTSQPLGLGSGFDIGAAHYEQRIIAYFDILGWKKHVEAAIGDPARVQYLRMILSMFSVFEKINMGDGLPGAKISTFSDSVIASVPYDPALIKELVLAIGKIQLGVGFTGFLLRGALTVGPLFHSDEAVFGPGLNRAYDLESRKAINPRILIDTDVPDLKRLHGPFIDREDDLSFLDPWLVDFCEDLFQNQAEVSVPMKKVEDTLGMKFPDISKAHFTGLQAMHKLLEGLSLMLQEPMRERDWSKVAWLFDRIAPRVGVTVKAAQLPRNMILE